MSLTLAAKCWKGGKLPPVSLTFTSVLEFLNNIWGLGTDPSRNRAFVPAGSENYQGPGKKMNHTKIWSKNLVTRSLSIILKKILMMKKQMPRCTLIPEWKTRERRRADSMADLVQLNSALTNSHFSLFTQKITKIGSKLSIAKYNIYILFGKFHHSWWMVSDEKAGARRS